MELSEFGSGTLIHKQLNLSKDTQMETAPQNFETTEAGLLLAVNELQIITDSPELPSVSQDLIIVESKIVIASEVPCG
jgi:hypothetical protein